MKITSVWLGALLLLLLLAETVLASNTLPKALITTPGELNRFKPGVVVPFNGSESYDPDGGAITFYKWYVDGVLESSGGSPSYSMFHRSFTLASGERYRSVTITLEVRDDELSWSSVSRTFTITEVTTYYYITDHVGSIRSIVDDGGFEVSYEDFDPFGAPLPGRSQDSGLAYHQNKFTGHERDSEDGLDLDYMQSRTYDPDLGRFLSVDPLADDFAGWTSYHYVHNNPINMVDPTGMVAEHIDVTKNEDGTYKVVGGQANSDKNIYVVDGTGKRTGEVVGEMLTEYSFHHEDGSAVIGANINLNDKSGQNFMDNEIKNIGLIDYISNAQGKEPLDFKHRGMNDKEKGVTVSQHYYRGMSFNGKVASARDIGNYVEGYVAGKHGFGWGFSRFAFDALQTKQEKGKWNTILFYPFNRVREGQPTQQAERAGHKVGYSIFKQRQFKRQ